MLEALSQIFPIKYFTKSGVTVPNQPRIFDGLPQSIQSMCIAVVTYIAFATAVWIFAGAHTADCCATAIAVIRRAVIWLPAAAGEKLLALSFSGLCTCKCTNRVTCSPCPDQCSCICLIVNNALVFLGVTAAFWQIASQKFTHIHTNCLY